jgi:surface antigen
VDEEAFCFGGTRKGAFVRALAERPIILAVLALALASCAEEPGPKTGAGIATGALAGGLIGAATGRRPGSVIAGAVIGGIVGGSIGNALDAEDRRRAYMAEMQALEYGGPGAPVSWRGEHGAYGTIVAGPAYPQGGYERCREYTHTIYIQGQPQNARGVACRNPDGTWTPIS